MGRGRLYFVVFAACAFVGISPDVTGRAYIGGTYVGNKVGEMALWAAIVSFVFEKVIFAHVRCAGIRHPSRLLSRYRGG